jgi:hypothetical protein
MAGGGLPPPARSRILSENENRTLFSVGPFSTVAVSEEKPEPQPTREENPWFIPENSYDKRLFAPEMDPEVYRNFDYNKANNRKKSSDDFGDWLPKWGWASFNLMYLSLALGAVYEHLFNAELSRTMFEVLYRLILWSLIVVVRQWWRWFRRR